MILQRFSGVVLTCCRKEASIGPSPGRLGYVDEDITAIACGHSQKGGESQEMRNRIRAQSNAVASHLDRIEEVALGIQKPRDPEQGRSMSDTAHADQLISAVRDLRQVRVHPQQLCACLRA